MSARVLRIEDPSWARSTARALTWIAALCAAVFVAGLFVAPERAWSGFLIGFVALTGLALAGPVGLAFLHLSGGRWARSLEIVPRSMSAALPAAAALGLVLVAGVHSLYEWSHAAVVDADAVLTAKSAYLNTPFFALRLIGYFALWYVSGRAVVRASLEARGDSAEERRRRLRAGAVFLLIFAPTWSLASVDWLQSLDPHWFSAIYALITLSGLAVAGVAAVIVLTAAADCRHEVTDAQWGDLGALMMALGLFWGYIWYSQYLLVWYTNLPEETPWYVARLAPSWGLLTKVSCVLCSAVPFALLLVRRLRRNRTALVRIAALVLVGRVVDLYVLAGPPLMGATPRAGVWEVAPVLGALASFFLLTVRALRRTRPSLEAPNASAPSSVVGAAT